MKKLMLLGASKYIKPVVECAHKYGIYIITCDDNAEHIGHSYADEYRIVDLIDVEAVLKTARELEIDGILSYACDCGVTTAAYVADKMGLPMPGPYESVRILQNKDLFRAFLRDNGFNVPKSESYSTKEDAIKGISEFTFPVMVKPVDSAGSKGVTRVDSKEEAANAIEYAFSYSFCGRVLVEEFIEKEGFSTDSDCFSCNGELVVTTFSNQYFDTTSDNPYAPAGFVWPSTMSQQKADEFQSELQRLLRLLDMKSTQYNIEARVGTNGKCYLMEVAPRAGGNRIAEMIKLATGVDIIDMAVTSAVGNPVIPVQELTYSGNWCEVILHSNKSGAFAGVQIDESISDFLVEEDLWIEKGDTVGSFSAANKSIGTLIFNFDDKDRMTAFMSDIDRYVTVEIETE